MLKAAGEALSKAEKDEAIVKFICPFCGGIAITNSGDFGGHFHCMEEAALSVR